MGRVHQSLLVCVLVLVANSLSVTSRTVGEKTRFERFDKSRSVDDEKIAHHLHGHLPLWLGGFPVFPGWWGGFPGWWGGFPGWGWGRRGWWGGFPGWGWGRRGGWWGGFPGWGWGRRGGWRGGFPGWGWGRGRGGWGRGFGGFPSEFPSVAKYYSGRPKVKSTDNFGQNQSP